MKSDFPFFFIFPFSDIEEVGLFGERERSRIFSYTGKQMISREVEAEKIRRMAAKTNTAAPAKESDDLEKKG